MNARERNGLFSWVPGQTETCYSPVKVKHIRPGLLNWHLVIIMVMLTACGGGLPLKPTASTGGNVIGRLYPWTPDTPIEGRQLTLCRTIGDQTKGNCELMESAVESDERGRFQIDNVPEGVYFVLYDSRLSDFGTGLKEWGGRTLHFGDREWLIEFLGASPDDGWVPYRLPDGISPSPHEGWLSHYCGLTLLIGQSPFIIAHDMAMARDQHQLKCFLVEVKSGKTSQIDVSVTYFD